VIVRPLSLQTLPMTALLCAAAAVRANDVILAVPEPASFGMLLAALGLVGFAVRRRAG
jgi:hypothetical protein